MYPGSLQPGGGLVSFSSETRTRMTRYRRTSGQHNGTPRPDLKRIYAHTSPKSRNTRHQRHVHLRTNDEKRRDRKDDLEDMFRSLLCGENGTNDDENRSSDGTSSSDDSEWDEETTLVEILGSPYLSRFHPYNLFFC